MTMTTFRRIGRGLVAAAMVAAGVALPATPASAYICVDLGPGGVACVWFLGTANIACFGCGTSSGTASLSATGVAHGGVIVGGAVNATYTVVEDNDPTTCVISGTATGTTTGAVSVSFNWTRVGAVAVITTSGDINGAGLAAFVVTSPAGIPCRSAVTAAVTGFVG